MTVWQELPESIAKQLLHFAENWNNKEGDSLIIEGKKYIMLKRLAIRAKLMRLSSISIYFKTGRSLIRLSDYWSSCNFFPLSQKMHTKFLNCFIGYDKQGNAMHSMGVFWHWNNTQKRRIPTRMIPFQYPIYLGVGICSMRILMKEHKKQLTK